MEDNKTPLVVSSNKSSEEQPARWKAAVSVIAVIVIAIILFKMFLKILIPVLVGIILVANYDIVLKVVKAIYKLYQDETYKGLLATVVAVIAFVPFVGFLFLRSVYNMFIAPKMANASNAGTTESAGKEDMTTKIIGVALKEKMKDILGGDEKK